MEGALNHAADIHDTQKTTAIAASFVNSITAAAAAMPPPQPVAQQPLPGRQVVVAVPDTPVPQSVIEQIQKRIAAEEAAAAEAHAANSPTHKQ
jgi:hypothetical protein